MSDLYSVKPPRVWAKQWNDTVSAMQIIEKHAETYREAYIRHDWQNPDGEFRARIVVEQRGGNSSRKYIMNGDWAVLDLQTGEWAYYDDAYFHEKFEVINE